MTTAYNHRLMLKNGVFFSKVWCLLRPLFWYSVYGTNQVVLCRGLKSASGVLLLGPLGRDFHIGEGQLLPVTGPRTRGRSYKVIWLFDSFAGSGRIGRGHIENISQLPPVQGLGQVSKRHKAPQAVLPPIDYL